MMHGSNSNHEIYMMHPSQNNNKGDNLVMLAAKKLNEFGILYLQQAIDKTTIARLQKRRKKYLTKLKGN